MYIVLGLGNPGEEYEKTRHNTGRMAVEAFAKVQKFAGFKDDKKTQSLKVGGKVGKTKVMCLLPETFMNKSGNALKKTITSQKAAEKLIVIQDEIDIPLGSYKVSFNKGSAGHRGVESIIKAVKTKEFFRIRVGVSPATPKGKIKKPKREKVLDFLMGNFKPAELVILKKTFKKTNEEIGKIVSEKLKPPAKPKTTKPKKPKKTKKNKK